MKQVNKILSLLLATLASHAGFSNDVELKNVQENVEFPLLNHEIKVRGFKFNEVERPKEKQIQLEKTLRKLSSDRVTHDIVTDKADVTDRIWFKTFSAENINVGDLIKRIKRLHSEKKILRLHIVGHTDNQKIRATKKSQIKNNQQLSEARAKLVANSLFKHNMEFPLSFEGKGSSDPLATNSTADGRRMNRRTDVLIFLEKKRNLSSAKQKKQIPQKVLLQEITCLNTPPETEAPSPIFQEEKTQSFKHTVYFSKLNSELPNEIVQEILRKIQLVEGQRKVKSIDIEGHTDSDPIIGRAKKVFADNKALGLARAKIVADALRKKYKNAPINIEGKGADEPLVPNTSKANKAKNRRTEIKIVYTGSEINLSQKTEKKVLPQKNGPVRITLDGQAFKKGKFQDNNQSNHVDFQRCTDVALEKAKLQVHFSSLENTKRLDFSVQSYLQGETLQIYSRAYSNYLDYIKRAELILVAHKNSPFGDSLKVIEFDRKPGQSQFKDISKSLRLSELNIKAGESVDFYLRVYDRDNTFDQTEARTQMISQQFNLPSNEKIEEGLRNSFGESSLERSQIVVEGGSVLVNGEELPSNYKVYVMGNEIPVGKNSKFVEEQILQSGQNYGIQVEVRDQNEKSKMFFQRDLRLPDNDWFLVALADATVGYNFKADKKAAIITQDTHHYKEKIYVDGRTAFYLKGKMQGKYILTAHADTREGPVENLFSNFLNKYPDDLFRRLDPDEFYPVYGDDSTLTEDAPTSGKFYVKIERNKSYLMWGNFKVDLQSTELARINRGYYGGHLKLREGFTQWGEHSTQVDIYAADPGTVSGRQDFRGGSSQYWLRNRDISVGSEQVFVEIRDRPSQRVLKRTALRYGEDYEINYLAGHISLDDRLPSLADNSRLVQAGALSGNPVYLVVTYEFTPGFSDPAQWELGGRAAQWLGSHLKIGATAHRQNDIQTGQDYELLAGDLELKLSGESSFKAEYAKTKGSTASRLNSLDGGYTFNPAQPPIPPGTEAQAYLGELNLKLFDVEGRSSRLGTYYKFREKGFSSSGEEVSRDLQNIGGELTLPFGRALSMNTQYDLRKEKQWVESQELSTDVEIDWSKRFYTDLGTLYNVEKDLSNGLSSATIVNSQFGERIDGALKMGIHKEDRWDYYLIGQKTLSKTKSQTTNDRYGAGASFYLTPKLKIGAEGTGGDGGLALRADANYKYSEISDYYSSFVTETERSDQGIKTRSGRRLDQLVSGVKSKYTDDTKVYYENKYLNGDRPTGLTHTFGVEYSLDSNWSFNLGVELGKLESEDKSTITKREAYHAGLDYANSKTSFGTQFELLFDESQTVSAQSKRSTYISKTKFSKKLTPSWRTLAKLKWQKSDDSKGDFFDGDYIDGVLGFAHRPVDNDRWNFLFKYRFFDLEPSPGQVDDSGNIPNFQQRDHILSGDFIWDMTKPLSLGFKYAVNFSSLKNNRFSGGNWFQLTKHLAVLRFDFHVIKAWDFLLEGRALHLDVKNGGLKEWKYGALTGVYRHLSNKGSIKLGLGYNFGSFSDDLTDNDYQAQGVFLNLIGAY